ncbi:MAG: hypothetical protein M3313_17560 [Actinomycetota bacterium]|nr:hypothetical protein [Actinomycetota bacterium]
MSFSPADGWLLIAHLGVLVGPGAVVALAAGLRPWIAFSSAPLITYGMTTVAGPLTGSLGLRWGPAILAAATVLYAGLAALLRIFPARTRARSALDSTATAPGRRLGSDLAMCAGVLVGTVLSIGASVAGMGSLAALNQDWDAVFHANAVHFIMDTGNAAPAALAAINDFELGSFYYPNSFHALAAVTGTLTGAEIGQLLNTPIALLGGLAGLGLALLLRTFGARVSAAAAAPVLLAGFASFPYDVSWRGPLIPFAMGLALLPAFAVVVEASLASRHLPTILVSGAAACGLFGLHPSVAVVGLIFIVALLGARWTGRPERIRGDLLVMASVGLVAAALCLSHLLDALGTRVVGIQDWPAVTTAGRAFGDLVLLNHDSASPQYWLVLLMGLGALGVAKVRGLWWWLAVAGIFGGLFILAAAYEGPLVAELTGLWWNDRYRLAAVAVLGFVVLAANGVVVLSDALMAMRRRLPRLASVPPRSAVGVVTVVVLAAYGLLSSGFYVRSNETRMSWAYSGQLPYARGVNVTEVDREGMDVLADLVEPGQRVMNDPNDGSALMYALVDVRPMFGHITPNPLDKGPDRAELVQAFNCLDSDPAIRALVAKYDIGFVFQGSELLRPGMVRFPGLAGLDRVDSLTQVWSGDGDVGIFRVDLQPLAAPSRSCTGRT